MPTIKTLGIACLCALLSACASTTNNSVSGVQRSQLLLLPSATVDKMSAQSYTQTLQDAQKNHTLNADKALLNRVTTISHRLIAQVGVFRPDATKWKWEINVEKKMTSSMPIACLAARSWCFPVWPKNSMPPMMS